MGRYVIVADSEGFVLMESSEYLKDTHKYTLMCESNNLLIIREHLQYLSRLKNQFPFERAEDRTLETSGQQDP
jgi:hypothetical protein